MTEPTTPRYLIPARGKQQPVEGWRAAEVDPSELVDDEWIAENTTPLVCQWNVFGAGFSKFAIATSALFIRSRTAPLSPVRRMVGTG